jgi:ADP-ribose pyrophosphatase
MNRADEPNLLALDRHLREQKVEGGAVFEGRFLKVQRDCVAFPDAHPPQQQLAYREFVKHPGASMVIPILEDGRVVIERQYRYPHQQVFTEFPAGKIDAGEDPEQTALRELREETGYQAGEIAHLTTIHNAIAY